MRRHWLYVPAAGALTIMLSGCIVSNPNYAGTSVTAAPSQLPPVMAAVRAPVIRLRFPAVGVYERTSPASYTGVARFAAATGTPVRLAMYYETWGGSFRAAFAVQAARHGAVTLVMLEPWKVNLVF